MTDTMTTMALALLCGCACPIMTIIGLLIGLALAYGRYTAQEDENQRIADEQRKGNERLARGREPPTPVPPGPEPPKSIQRFAQPRDMFVPQAAGVTPTDLDPRQSAHTEAMLRTARGDVAAQHTRPAASDNFGALMFAKDITPGPAPPRTASSVPQDPDERDTEHDKPEVFDQPGDGHFDEANWATPDRPPTWSKRRP